MLRHPEPSAFVLAQVALLKSNRGTELNAKETIFRFVTRTFLFVPNDTRHAKCMPPPYRFEAEMTCEILTA